MRAICQAPESTKDGTLRSGFFLDLLRRSFAEPDAQQQLDIAIDWGRYSELYEYDDNTTELVLERAVIPQR